jgi:hypothetical protein
MIARERRGLDRRGFLATLGSALVAVPAAGALAACGRDSGPAAPAAGMGEIRGTVVDLTGQPDGVGRIFLMYDNGLQTGRYQDVDGEGQFRFPNVVPANYKVRFHAPRQARVPAYLPNPERVAVAEDGIANVIFQIERGVFNENMIEIYAGDDFFQEQPYGDPNATATVKLGTVVCWYNVGERPHNVTGGPWGTSGTLDRSGSYIWEADQVGTFQYECTLHSPQMRATLVVEES